MGHAPNDERSLPLFPNPHRLAPIIVVFFLDARDLLLFRLALGRNGARAALSNDSFGSPFGLAPSRDDKWAALGIFSSGGAPHLLVVLGALALFVAHPSHSRPKYKPQHIITPKHNRRRRAARFCRFFAARWP